MSSAGKRSDWGSDHRMTKRVSTSPDPLGFRTHPRFPGDFASSANVHYSTVPLIKQGDKYVEDIAAIHSPNWTAPTNPFPDDPMSGHPLQESQLLHFAEVLHALRPRQRVWNLVHDLAVMMGLRVDHTGAHGASGVGAGAGASSNGTWFATVHHRDTFAAKGERPGVSLAQTIRSLRLARHAYGGSFVALFESDNPALIDTVRKLEPSITWVQLPRCLFAAAQGKGYVMKTINQQNRDVPKIRIDQSTGRPEWTKAALEQCPERAKLTVHDEGALTLATMLLMARGWPIVGGLHSSMFKSVTAMAAAVHWPPPVVDTQGGVFAHTAEAAPWVNICKEFVNADISPYLSGRELPSAERGGR